MSNTNTTASNAAPEKNDAMPLKLDVRVRPITPKENLVGFAHFFQLYQSVGH